MSLCVPQRSRASSILWGLPLKHWAVHTVTEIQPERPFLCRKNPHITISIETELEAVHKMRELDR